MVCYICNNPASAKCPKCNRYICTKHTCRWGKEYICSNCYNEEQALQESERKSRLEKIKQIWRCDFCGEIVNYDDAVKNFFYETEFGGAYPRLPKCRVCGKSYCSKHGQIISAKMLDCTGYWYRCINHLKKPGILGRHELTGFFETMFIGEPDTEVSDY